MTKIIVSYHGACIDGSTAAAICKMKHKEAAFVPVRHRKDEEAKEELLSLIAKSKDNLVYMLDNPFFARELAKSANKLVILDHHIGEHENLKSIEEEFDNVKYIFDNEESGASLAWRYFFPEKEEPAFVSYVKAGDIWKKEGIEKEVDLVETYASIYLDNLDKYIEMINSNIEDIFSIAHPIVEYKDMLVDYYLRNAKALHIKIGEYIVKAYNIASIRPVVSEIGNKLSKQTKETVMLFKVFGDVVNVSFRSAGDFSPSALELAQSLGGNGHKRAAGAAMDLKKFLDSIVLS